MMQTKIKAICNTANKSEEIKSCVCLPVELEPYTLNKVRRGHNDKCIHTYIVAFKASNTNNIQNRFCNKSYFCVSEACTWLKLLSGSKPVIYDSNLKRVFIHVLCLHVSQAQCLNQLSPVFSRIFT